MSHQQNTFGDYTRKAAAYAVSALLFALSVCLPAQADDEFLTFKDPPSRQVGPFASVAETPSLTELKLLIGTPQLWETRLGGRAMLDAPSAPAAQGQFTPRYAGSEVSLYSGGVDPSGAPSGLEVSLFAQPLTISGLAPVALDTGDISDEQSYNLGLNLGISRFQVGAAVSRITGAALDFGATGVDLDMRYLGDSWQTNLALSSLTASEPSLRTLGGGLGLVHDQSFAVEWGASFLLTPRLSLGGSLRFSGFKDEVFFGPDSSLTTDSSVFLGTNIKF